MLRRLTAIAIILVAFYSFAFAAGFYGTASDHDGNGLIFAKIDIVNVQTHEYQVFGTMWSINPPGDWQTTNTIPAGRYYIGASYKENGTTYYSPWYIRSCREGGPGRVNIQCTLLIRPNLKPR